MGAAKQTVGELFQAMSKTNQRRIPRGGFGADGGRATSMFGFAYYVSGTTLFPSVWMRPMMKEEIVTVTSEQSILVTGM